MHNDDITLNPDYLHEHCPIAWNTPERIDIYAALGFEIVRTAFAVIRRHLGDDRLAAKKLPLSLNLAFDVVAQKGKPPIIRVALDQDEERCQVVSVHGKDGGSSKCTRPPDQKPALDAAYLDAHEPINSCEGPMRAAYAVLGYATEIELVQRLLEKSGHEKATFHDYCEFTVDTTKTAGGCAVVCNGEMCTHQNRTDGSVPGGG